MDTLRDSAKAEPGSGSDSEPEAGDQLRMSFLGDTKKRGKATPGVFAQVAEDAQVHLLPAGQVGCHIEMLRAHTDMLGVRQLGILPLTTTCAAGHEIAMKPQSANLFTGRQQLVCEDCRQATPLPQHHVAWLQGHSQPVSLIWLGDVAFMGFHMLC